MRIGDAGGSRTPDLLRDRQAFYSSELRNRMVGWGEGIEALSEATTRPVETLTPPSKKDILSRGGSEES